VSELGAYHARAVVASFSEIDKLLGEIETLAMPSRSPFARIANDLSPTQHDEIASHVRYVREQMVEALATLGIGLRAGGGSSKGAILTRLSFAEIAVDEAAPKRLRGYGAISKASEITLERMLADLSRALRSMRRVIGLDASKDVAARLARLEQTPIDLAMLGKLERVISQRGLVELRGLLDALVEQLESRTFEVAVFGHVSSGKSTLLNAVLGLDILPVGVTPVTAVPTRIVSGDETLVQVSFSSGRGEKTFPITELPSFVSEAQNPGNEKRVRRVTVTVRSERLPRGVALVDTPGVGTLATAGARETHTYLPRCDLGIVLVDAAGSLAYDDIRLVRALRDSAIPAMLVVSKADLVAAADRQRLADYVHAEIEKATGLDPPLHWVSGVGPTANAREWFDGEIEPLLQRSRQNAEASSQRKLGQLYESVISSLRAIQGQVSVDSEARSMIEQIAGEAERMLQKRRARCDDLADTISDLAAPIVRLATERFAQASGGERIAKDLVRAATLLTTDELRGEVRGELEVARDELARLLSDMARMVGADWAGATLQLDLLTMPVVEIPRAVDRFRFSPSWVRMASSKRQLQDQMVRDLGEPLHGALLDFQQSLRAWCRGAGERLSEQFAALAGPLRSRVRAPAASEGDGVDRDLEGLGAAASVVNPGA
jgi:GTP-binding protein EngB required for normal cell division